VSATPIRKTIHASNQEERHPGLRKLIPPPEAVVLPIIGRTPTPIVPRTVSVRAIFVHVDIASLLSLHCRDRETVVRSHPMPVALVAECSIPVVENVARQPRPSHCWRRIHTVG